MGADLYISMIHDKQKAKYEPLFSEWVRKRDEAVDEAAKKTCQEKVTYYYEKMNDSAGYFRDSYNDSNLLWLFGLDYWEYFSGLLEKGGIMKPETAQKLLDELKLREPVFNVKLTERMEKVTAKDKTETAKSVKDYFIRKYFEFQKFLQTAIDNNYDIDCSI